MTATNGWLLTPPAANLPEVPFAEAVRQAGLSLPDTLPERPDELVFALDIDGTVVGASGVTRRMTETIAAAQKAGAEVVIATGRGIYSTQAVVRDLGLEDGWGVCSNGSVTVEWGRNHPQGHVVSELFDFEVKPTAERFLETFPSILLGVDAGLRGMLVSQVFPAGELMQQTLAGSLEELLGGRASRLVARAPWLERDDFAQQIDEMGLKDVEYAVGWTSWADIGPAGVTKATGLQRLIEKLEKPKNGTIALGDGDNDLAMLQWAAHGVAMGSAAESVKAAADAVTTPVEQDGAAAVIQAVLDRY